MIRLYTKAECNWGNVNKTTEGILVEENEWVDKIKNGQIENL